VAERLSQKALGWIRKSFQREQEVRRELGPRRPYFDPSGRDFNLMSMYGYDVVGDYLKLDHDLFTRFYDYEEMDDYPDLAAALDIYADDSTCMDAEKKKSIWIEGDDADVVDGLNSMLGRTRAEEQVWEQARSLCKYGNNYEEMLVNDQGVQALAFMPPATVRRIDGIKGENLGFVQSFSGDFTVDPTQFGDLLNSPDMQSGGESAIALEGWRISHMRIRSKYRAAMYGHSVLDPARWIWKRLMLLEDAVLIYKLTRSPSRYAFYIDTGRLQGDEALAYTNRVAQMYKKKKFVNPKTGQLDLQFNPLGYDEDFFLPVGTDGRGSKIEVLSGPTFQSMEDVEYFLKKLFAAIKIPRAYLGFSEDIAAKATLSQQDVRFARTVLRIQREIRNGWRKIAEVDLAARNIDPQHAKFDVMMSVPSSLFEMGQMEVRNSRAALASAMERNVSQYWILQNVYGMSDDEIKVIIKQRRQEKLEDAKWDAEVQRAMQLGMEGQPILAVSKEGEPVPNIPLPSAQADMASADSRETQIGGGSAPKQLMPHGFASESRRQRTVTIHPLARSNLSMLPRRGNGVITERELMSGRPGDERDARAELERVMSRNPTLVASIEESRKLLKELAASQRYQRHDRR
jgi:hypothetical protein